MRLWWRRNRQEEQDQLLEAERRLAEAEEVGKRAARVGDKIRGHMKRNDFGAMIDEALRDGRKV